jgi:hypothetical protein
LTRARSKRAETYRRDEKALLRPQVGTQVQFKKRKPLKTYRYDSSLSTALASEVQNPGRELGEWLLAQIEEAAALVPPENATIETFRSRMKIELLDARRWRGRVDLPREATCPQSR